MSAGLFGHFFMYQQFLFTFYAIILAMVFKIIIIAGNKSMIKKRVGLFQSQSESFLETPFCDTSYRNLQCFHL